MKLTRTTAGSIVRDVATGTIVDDDLPPWVTVTDPRVAEGDPDQSAEKLLDFRVTLSAPSEKGSAVWYEIQNVTAASSDYRLLWPQPNQLIFEPGQTTKVVRLVVTADNRVESNETVRLRLFGPRDALIAREAGTGTIVDDCPPGETCE